MIPTESASSWNTTSPKYLIWAVLGENTTALPYTNLFQPHVWWWCLSKLGGNNTVAWWSLWAGWVEVGCADVTIPVYIHCGIPQAIVVRLWCHAWRRIKPFHWPMYYNCHEYQWADCIGAIKRFHCKPHIYVNFTGRCHKTIGTNSTSAPFHTLNVNIAHPSEMSQFLAPNSICLKDIHRDVECLYQNDMSYRLTTTHIYNYRCEPSSWPHSWNRINLPACACLSIRSDGQKNSKIIFNSLGPSDAIWRWGSCWLIIGKGLWHSSEDIIIRRF